MEATLTPVQKLDEVLFLFDTNTNHLGIHKLNLANLLKKKNIDISERLLIEILHKLSKDNYLRIEIGDEIVGTKVIGTVPYYLLSFEGELFQINGGYLSEAKSLDARKRWEDELLIKGEKNGERLNKLTLILGIGTIALAAMEIIKFCYELYRASKR